MKNLKSQISNLKFAALLCFAAFNAAATVVYLPTYDFTGSVQTNKVSFIAKTKVITDGTNSYYGFNVSKYPTSGSVTQALIAADYWVVIDGIPVRWSLSVTNTGNTNPVNAVWLQNDLPTYTFTNLFALSNYLSLTTAAATYVPLAGGTLAGPLTNLTADARGSQAFNIRVGTSSNSFVTRSGYLRMTNNDGSTAWVDFNNGIKLGTGATTIVDLDTTPGTAYGGTIRGNPSGDGSALTNLSATQLLSGTVPLAVLPTNPTNDLRNALLPTITNSTPLVWGQRTNLWSLFLGASYTDTNAANGYGFHTMWLYTNYMIPNETSVTFSNYGTWGQNNYDKSNEFFTAVHPFIVNSAKSTNFATISTGEASQNDYNQTELNGAGLMTTPTPEQSFSYYTSVVTRIVLDYTATNSFTNFAIISHLVHPMAQQETPARALWRNKYNELVLGFNPGGFVKAWMNWGKFMNQPANTNMFRASDFTHPTLAASTNATLEFANIFGHILNGRPVPLPAPAWTGAAPEWNLQSSNVFAQKLGGSNITIFPTVANTVALDIYEQGAGFGFPFIYRMTYGNNSGLITNRYQLRVVFTGSGVNAQYQMLEYVPGLAFTANKELQRLYANGNTECAGMLTGTNGLYFPQGTNTAPTAAIIGGTVGSVTNYLQKNVGGVLMLYWSDGTTLYSKQLGP